MVSETMVSAGKNATDHLGVLERLQMRILQRITDLESSLHAQLISPNISDEGANPSASDGGRSDATDARLSAILRSIGAVDFTFRRVPLDYYDKTLEERKEILGAASVHHLCKSIVMVNTQASANVIDCSDPNNSKFYIVVMQYVARLNAESIKNFLYALNNQKIPKKRFNLRLAPEEESMRLTGFVHNAVTCVGMKTDIPVILDEAITKLQPDFFWLGGGEVDLKLGIRTAEFISTVKPFIVSCTS
ncbi:hypothetical protein HPP92_014040 [Vanilla planifolia]|uniref:YbaK/aminoacyl-tRNA synthetase-associated domain-containing protein n=1 Tax=Vanilla planifolia TaxID=51239 RepID=A0A835QKJ2_VANPL|nr:hypothetical protein HPP92_014478 [Vanilla planifolia]KAG0474354.1 hypothetical protein HPP92_014040 [Vanilla planifolia]